MKKEFRSFAVKILASASVFFLVSVIAPQTVKADALTDAILAKQEQIIQEQVELQKQSVALYQMYQYALLEQYQKAYTDQYNAAMLVQQGFAAGQVDALSQSYILNAMQAQHAAQYESMINSLGLEYKDYLMSDFLKNQKTALTAFRGYYGLNP